MKRWLKNIKWLFNHPPTNFTHNHPKFVGLACKYCGSTEDNIITISHIDTSICLACIKRVFDHALSAKDAP